jgi:hypothetical protein
MAAGGSGAHVPCVPKSNLNGSGVVCFFDNLLTRFHSLARCFPLSRSRLIPGFIMVGNVISILVRLLCTTCDHGLMNSLLLNFASNDSSEM